ncbi:MAG TPA: 4Fe-4S binding protein, partial [Spirochaetota bacterium]|nr:4Fe-4S binding protein [Spirochaetota bacterium]
KGNISPAELKSLREKSQHNTVPMYNDLMNKSGWPEINFDGRLFMSHQDVLFAGGKVQAADGFADHIKFKDPEVCKTCTEKLCIEMCSAQAITPGENGVPAFDREKCIHCGACMWNCTRADKNNPEYTNIDFQAGSGGLHSAEN